MKKPSDVLHRFQVSSGVFHKLKQLVPMAGMKTMQVFNADLHLLFP
jgi:hypothetical protein